MWGAVGGGRRYGWRGKESGVGLELSVAGNGKSQEVFDQGSTRIKAVLLKSQPGCKGQAVRMTRMRGPS